MINWTNLSKAIEFYKNVGYQYVELPWTAPQHILEATCPNPDYIIKSDLGGLVGSSEQSFMARDNIGELGKGRFVTCTPCFRYEPTLDLIHQNTFMKVEIYRNDKTDVGALWEVIDDCKMFFETLSGQSNIDIAKIGNTYDLMMGDIELGSYGIRSFDNIRWIYGTGLAEPRFSIAKLTS